MTVDDIRKLKFPRGIHMVTITRNGETWTEPERKSIQAFDEMREAIPLLLAEIDRVAAERDEWKRRAASHGCDVDNGDVDCG